MLNVSSPAAQEGSEEAARTEEIAFVVSSTQRLRNGGSTVVVSNRHALLQHAEFDEDDAAMDRDGFIDWEVMRSTMWTNTEEHPDRKERRQAECLAHPSVPWSAVSEVITKTEDAGRRASTVVRHCGAATPVRVRPHWYF